MAVLEMTMEKGDKEPKNKSGFWKLQKAKTNSPLSLQEGLKYHQHLDLYKAICDTSIREHMH